MHQGKQMVWYISLLQKE
ncbi:hypothetical protein Gotur_017604 [Gossypium turneri]